MKFNPQKWSIADEIKKRVQIEDNARWASERSFPPLKPRNDAVLPQIQPSVGWRNFYRNIIKFSMEFRP